MCSCIAHLLSLQSWADEEAKRLRKKFHIYGMASRNSDNGGETLVAKLEYDVAFYDSIIRSLKTHSQSPLDT